MELKPISYKTALLAKEKGFAERCYDYYVQMNKNSKAYLTKGTEYMGEGCEDCPVTYISFDWNLNIEPSKQIRAPYPNKYHPSQASAPSQDLLMHWLRETHGLHIWIIPYGVDYRYFLSKNQEFIHSKSNEGESYHDLFEEALQEALKLIK